MSKLPHVGTTIFTVMSALANEHQAINLSQGFPNFKIDDVLTNILQKISKENVHQYAPMSGLPILNEKVSALIEKQYNRKVHPGNEILITAGATQAIFATIQAIVDQGDEVLILDPSYDCYEAPVVLCKAKPVHVSLNDDYSVNWERVNNTVNVKTKLLIINNPHNPSGKVWSAHDFVELERLMNKFPELLLLSDEVYEYITYEKKHISINEFPSIYQRAIIVSSFGKTFHITGWKIGYITAPSNLLNEIKKVHQFLVFCVNSPAQHALAEYLDHVEVSDLGKFYQQKRDLFKNLMSKSRFQLLPSEGTYFQVASYKEISDLSDIEFTKKLVVENGVAAIPISVFNVDGKDDKRIRFCYAKDDQTLIQAAEKLCKI